MRTRTWFLISLGFFLAALLLWRMGESRRLEKIPPAATTKTNLTVNPFFRLPRLKHSLAADSQKTGALASLTDPRFPYRLHNTAPQGGQWFRSETAVLLRNAFIETAVPVPVAIPAHLRAAGDPGSYVVQARGFIDQAFREQLKAVGAEIVSYVPNNAYLVRLSAAEADRLAGMPRTQSVLPFEPYYKLDEALLPLAARGEPLPEGQWINVVFFPGQREAGLAELRASGAKVQSEQRTPFGQMFAVLPKRDSLVALAQSPAVHGLEWHYEKAVLNDLQRDTMGVSSPSTNTASHLDLTGSGVLVGVNDTGIEAAHPDLAGRVISAPVPPLVPTDTQGHGTHVAGIIASSGANSPPAAGASGSTAPADFRGKAPQALLYPLPFIRSDDLLQETTSRTNIHVSNNSWGFLTPVYNFSSASYDAAVRDSDPVRPGSQPVLYVFAAGNSGNGDDNGAGAVPDTITPPGNGKNVLTVGALEQMRNITNEVHYAIVITNIYYDTNIVGTAPNLTTNVITNIIIYTNIGLVDFKAETDSRDQVAGYSSRGNVGIGTEGDFGRFKPDVVAPGTFVVSTAIAAWQSRTNNTNILQYLISAIVDSGLLPNYRYDTGTSMAAPGVTGMLALMEEYFVQRLGRTNSPALMKALVINGARPLGVSGYSLSPYGSVNDQGWGAANLTNSLPLAMADAGSPANWPIIFMDQSPTNVLATGDSHSWSLQINNGDINQPSATNYPLRVTLAWTDPPGNPGVSAKLVNDLDLIVFDPATTNYFFGNHITPGNDFTEGLPADYLFGPGNVPTPFPTFVNPDRPGLSNAVPQDFVNNVENVFIDAPLSPNYIITVVGRRVNVNAVTEDNSNVVQDYALVISSANTAFTNDAIFSLTRLADATAFPSRAATPLNNQVTLQHQRAGANYQLLNPTNGVTNQWQFYIFTNVSFTNAIVTNVAGTNIGFVISRAVHLARWRNGNPDLDIYTSKDAGLTNLDPAVINAPSTFRLTTRGGNGVLLVTNGIIPGYSVSLGDVFYVGVKSEDQQAGEYSFTAISTDSFGQETNGGFLMRGFPLPAFIPDGSYDSPQGVDLFFICPTPITVANVSATNVVSHDDIGDLVTLLTGPDGHEIYLHNHSLNNGTNSGDNILLQYDERYPTTQIDGPGTLIDYLGTEGSGLWMMTFYDNSSVLTGMVNNAELFVSRDTNGTNRVLVNLQRGETYFTFADVPVFSTNLTIIIDNLVGGPVDLFVRRGAPPLRGKPPNDFEQLNILPNGYTLVIDRTTAPPLAVGRYYIAISNSGPSSASFFLQVTQGFSLVAAADQETFTTGNISQPIQDDSMTFSTLFVPTFRTIVDVGVNVAIDHPRVSDLTLHLFDPFGNRVLLFENRGGVTTGVSSTNLYANFTENTNFTTASASTLLPVKFAPVPFTNLLSPPLLVNSNRFDVSVNDAANGVAIVNNALFLGGTVRSNAGSFLDGLVVNYLLPITNTPPPDAAPRWWTNWPGQLNGPRVSDVVFNGVAATGEGVYLVGQTRENIPSPRASAGGPAPDFYFFDAGCNQGNLTIDYNFYNVPDQMTVYYNGVPLLNTGFINGSGRLTIPYGPGPSTIVTIVVNEFSGNAGTIWDYTVVSDCPVSPSTDTKAIMVKYPLDGPTGLNGSNGAIWFSRIFTPVPYGFDGNEHAQGDVAVDEFGTPFVYAVGSAEFRAGREGFVIAKVDANGRTIWERTDSGAFASGASRGNAVAVFSNSVVVAAGYTNIAGTDVPQIWSYATFGARNFARQSTQPAGRYYGVTTLNSNIYAVGTTDGTGASGDSLVEKWDLAGNLIWSVAADLSAGGANDVLLAVVGVGDRIYAVGTTTNSPVGGGVDATLLELDASSGAIISSSYYRQSGAAVSIAHGIATDGNDLYVVGEAGATGGASDAVTWRFKVKNFYQPEESLGLFQGLSSFGTWTLRVTDNRAGPDNSAIAPVILGWQLDFTYADASIFPTFLFPSIPYDTFSVTDQSRGGSAGLPQTFSTLGEDVFKFDAAAQSGTVTTSNRVHSAGLPGYDFSLTNREIRYFGIIVPADVTALTNFITADYPVKVLFNNSQMPTPTAPGNYPLTAGATNGVFTFITNGTPPLVPGGTYYLGVQNAGQYETNHVNILLSVLETNSAAALSNGVTVTGVVASGTTDFYQLPVSASASGVAFELLGLDGNADLYVRKGQPGVLALPGAALHDYRSINLGGRDEKIFVITNAPPVPLAPVTWYLGVRNADDRPVRYGVRATELYGSPFNEVPLALGASADGSTSAGNAPDSVFKVTIPPGASAALFEIVNVSGQVRLLARQGGVPLLGQYDLASRRSGPGSQQIVLRTNLAGLTNLSGDWFFTVHNNLPTTADYTVRATLPTAGVLISTEPLRLPAMPVFTPAGPLQATFDVLLGERYEVQYSDNLSDWRTLLITNAPPDGQITFTDPSATNAPARYYRVLQVPQP